MKPVRWTLFVVMFLAAPALFARESYRQCQDNCRPGNNACTQCCYAQGRPAMQPCFDACTKTCVETFCKRYYPAQSDYAKCLNDYRSEGEVLCKLHTPRDIRDTHWKCQGACYDSTMIAGNCPGEVPPQKCEFSCESWNSASKTCIGPRMNACAGEDKNPANKCPYDCQTWMNGKCIGAPQNGCKH